MRADLSRVQRQYIEEILFSIDDLRVKLEQLELDIIHGRPHQDVAPGGDYISDPTARAAIAVSASRAVARARFEVEAVDRALRKLPEEYTELFKYKYQEKSRDWDYIADMVGFTKRHCYRMRDQILEQVGRELALIE